MLPQRLPLEQMQVNWANQLNPVIANLLVQGQLLSNLEITTGSNVINHKLGRKPIGWFVVAPMGPVVLYQAAEQLLPNLLLTLTSDADVTLSLWVF